MGSITHPNVPISLDNERRWPQVTAFSIVMPSEPSDSPDDVGSGKKRARPPFSARSGPETKEPAGNPVAPWSELRARALLNSLSDLVFCIRKDGVVLECHLP